MPGCLSVSAADAPQSQWSMPCQGINLQLAHCTHEHGLITACSKLQHSTSKCSVRQSFAVPQSCCYLRLLFDHGLQRKHTLSTGLYISWESVRRCFGSEIFQGAIRYAGFQSLLGRAVGAGSFCGAQKLFVMCWFAPYLLLPCSE